MKKMLLAIVSGLGRAWHIFGFGVNIAVLCLLGGLTLSPTLAIVAAYYLLGMAVIGILVSMVGVNTVMRAVSISDLLSSVDGWPLFLALSIGTSRGRALLFRMRECPASPFGRDLTDNPFQSPSEF